jgi:hypothetical protein
LQREQVDFAEAEKPRQGCHRCSNAILIKYSFCFSAARRVRANVEQKFGDGLFFHGEMPSKPAPPKNKKLNGGCTCSTKMAPLTGFGPLREFVQWRADCI